VEQIHDPEGLQSMDQFLSIELADENYTLPQPPQMILASSQSTTQIKQYISQIRSQQQETQKKMDEQQKICDYEKMDSKLNNSLPYISNNRSSVNSTSCLQPQHA